MVEFTLHSEQQMAGRKWQPLSIPVVCAALSPLGWPQNQMNIQLILNKRFKVIMMDWTVLLKLIS